jgi:hypothetical protein
MPRTRIEVSSSAACSLSGGHEEEEYASNLKKERIRLLCQNLRSNFPNTTEENANNTRPRGSSIAVTRQAWALTARSGTCLN